MNPGNVSTPGLDEASCQVGGEPTPPIEPGPSLGPARLPDPSAATPAPIISRDLRGQGLHISAWIDGLVTLFAVDENGAEKPIARFTNVDVGDLRLFQISAGAKR